MPGVAPERTPRGTVLTAAGNNLYLTVDFRDCGSNGR